MSEVKLEQSCSKTLMLAGVREMFLRHDGVLAAIPDTSRSGMAAQSRSNIPKRSDSNALPDLPPLLVSPREGLNAFMCHWFLFALTTLDVGFSSLS